MMISIIETGPLVPENGYVIDVRFEQGACETVGFAGIESSIT